MEAAERKSIVAAFKQAVNMTPAKLRAWLATEASKTVGMTKAGQKVTPEAEGHSVGHGMGERILALKAKKAAELDEDDYAAMRKVVGYVHRHGKQRPKGDVTHTRWRHSLMNWGHDPLR
jgi:hypothetical protein